MRRCERARYGEEPKGTMAETDLTAIRARLAQRRRKAVLAEPRGRSPRRPSFRSTCTASFRRTPPSGSIRSAAASFLKLMSASLALAGVGSACTAQPDGADRSRTSASPRRRFPGRPLFFATAMTLGGVAHRPAGREPRRPADQGRRQSRSSRPASAPPICTRRRRCSRCTIPIARSRSCSSVRFVRGARSSRRCARAVGAVGGEGRRSPHPHRNGELADAGGADSAGARGAIPARSGFSGSR